MAESRRTSKKMKTGFPTDILFTNILKRLPGKSLSRFRCVSKQWHSSLKSPGFVKMHLDHVTNHDLQNHHKLLFFSAKTPSAFHTVDYEAGEDGLTASRSLPFVASSKYITILTSCNGLVCVGITKGSGEYYYSDMILWNPLTGDYKRLFNPSIYHNECYIVKGSASELYYSASDNSYNLLRLTTGRNAYIYSFSVNSWRRLNSTEDLKRRHSLVWGASTLQNGKLYFLDENVTRTQGQLSQGQLSYSIIRFDTNDEKFTVIATPWFGDETTVCLNSMLFNTDRKLHLCVIYKFSQANSTELNAKLWKLDGDEDWAEVVTYQIPGKYYSLKPVDFMRNGNWLTLCRTGCHVHERDPTKGFKPVSYLDTADKIDIKRKVIYIETLVTP